MHDSFRQTEALFFFLMIFIIFFAEFAIRLRVAYPIMLVIAGLGISVIPGLPTVELDPEIVFAVILPPLLFHAAWQTSWREFKFNLASIFMLAFGLVTFTVFGVALCGTSLFSLLDWRVGMVLGAIVAPTDAIAATSIARRLGLPEQVIDVLEGESLVNDATGLLALEFGIALVLNQHSPTFGEGAIRLVWLVIAGLGIGWVFGWFVKHIERLIDNGPIEVTLCLVTPYAAYLSADTVHASGVLAVVACGLFLGRHSSDFFSPGVRLQAYAMSDTLDFILNGVVFTLIGLQLPVVLAGLHNYTWAALLGYATGFSTLVILLRMLWIYPGAWLAYRIRKQIQKQTQPMASAKSLFVVGWTGMRGVVSLAAALSVPKLMANGQPFAGRDMIIFLTFSVILVTLVLQGLTLPAIVRLLGLGALPGVEGEEQDARRTMISAALEYLEETHQKEMVGADDGVISLYENLRELHRVRLAGIPGPDSQLLPSFGYARYKSLSHALLRVERRTALQLRREGKISDVVLHRLERELDLSESRIGAS